jgi:hypothetical protein
MLRVGFCSSSFAYVKPLGQRFPSTVSVSVSAVSAHPMGQWMQIISLVKVTASFFFFIL